MLPFLSLPGNHVPVPDDVVDAAPQRHDQMCIRDRFCTLSEALDQMELLAQTGAQVVPIISPIVAATDTRFGKAADFVDRIEAICGRASIRTVAEAEPIGPKKLLDLLVVAPCTGNTLAKLYNGIIDTSVTMACKAHLRNARPLVCLLYTSRCV